MLKSKERVSSMCQIWGCQDMCGYTGQDRIRNGIIGKNVEAAPTAAKIRVILGGLGICGALPQTHW